MFKGDAETNKYIHPCRDCKHTLGYSSSSFRNNDGLFEIKREGECLKCPRITPPEYDYWSGVETEESTVIHLKVSKVRGNPNLCGHEGKWFEKRETTQE